MDSLAKQASLVKEAKQVLRVRAEEMDLRVQWERRVHLVYKVFLA